MQVNSRQVVQTIENVKDIVKQLNGINLEGFDSEGKWKVKKLFKKNL